MTVNQYYKVKSKYPLCGLTIREAEELFRVNGIETSHARRVIANFYRRKIHDISLMDNVSKSLRNNLLSIFSTGLSQSVKSETSFDGSCKFLFHGDSGKVFETVVLPERKRKTVCISSQSGCRMCCPFCLTGRTGFRGNLTAGEMVNQVISVPEADKVDHIVFMGMGEPLDNLDEVLKACDIFTSQWGLAISPKNVTVSTVGITPEVRRFLDSSGCNLTLSLFSPFPEERESVVPAEKMYPVSEIIEIMKSCRTLKKRRLSVAYVMIKDVNDTTRHLEGLIRLLKGSGIRVNLLPYHQIPGDSFSPSTFAVMGLFIKRLLSEGISSSVRKSRGEDISAACGLLATGLGR
jgi:23S rRNA (adenine2503-C2)-methyltransferase